MNIIILTGPAAAGKNTISHLLARKMTKCAVIDVDLVRQMYKNPHKAPWEGEKGKLQQKLGVENTILIAENFVQKETDVVILDVVTDSTAKLYKKAMPEAKIILLMPTYEEVFKRFTNRPQTISEEEFKLIYEWQKNLTIYDVRIDNSVLSAEETAEKINSMF